MIHRQIHRVVPLSIHRARPLGFSKEMAAVLGAEGQLGWAGNRDPKLLRQVLETCDEHRCRTGRLGRKCPN
jgi:hypothetical protein